MRSIRVTIRPNLPRRLPLDAEHKQLAEAASQPFELRMPANDANPTRRIPF